MTDFFDSYGPSFLGLQLLRLYDTIDRGGNRTLRAASQDLPAKCVSCLVYLKHHGPSSISDLANAIGASHQLVSQRVGTLLEYRLLNKVTDIQDRRRALLILSAKGEKVAADVDALCRVGDDAYREFFTEIGVDLNEIVIRARKALEDRSLDDRIRGQVPALRADHA